MKPSNLSKNVILAFFLITFFSSCNQKLYQDALKKNEALEAQVVRSNKEIKDLRDAKQALEDEVKAKAAEVTRMTGEVQTSQKAVEEMNVRFKGLESQVQTLNKTIETQKTENSTMIANYEQKLGEMQQEVIALTKKRKVGRVKKKKA